MKTYHEQFAIWSLVFCHVLMQAAFENQQEDMKKSDRFGMSWFDGDPWLADPLPPAPLGPAPQRPQPARPPAPLDQARPPAPLAQPPAPIQTHHNHQKAELDSLTRGGVHAEDIRCVRSNGVTLLAAVVIPPPEYTSQPVFEDAVGPSYSPADCAMRPNDGHTAHRSFAMHVQHFNKCGVRVQQGSDGKEWISVTLRFPYMDGLRMAEDEYVMIMCKPQDRTFTTHHVMDLRPTATEVRSANKPRPVFRSGPRDMSCRVSLLAKGQGGRSFSKEMKSGSAVRVGQELQIRGQVREGDGWNHAMLKDVYVTRVTNKNRGHDATNSVDMSENAVYRDQRTVDTTHDVAQLVFSDGCRNPLYRPIAPLHPQRDPKNPLLVNFSFRAFMFQDMLDGETLRISVQVVACAELSDCQQVFCATDGQRGLGRKKRSTSNNDTESTPRQNVKNFTEDFQLMVTLGGFSKTPIVFDDVDMEVHPKSQLADCKLILIAVASAAILFCLVTTAATAIAIGNKRKVLLSPSIDEELKLKRTSEGCKRRK